jgi:hypothetical protein
MKKAILTLAATTLLLPASSLFAGTIIFQQNFDGLAQGLSQKTLGNMSTINGTNVDIVGPGLWDVCIGPESGNCVDLGGSGGGKGPWGQLESGAITLNPGVVYDLSFDLIGHKGGTGPTTTVVSFGPYSETFVLNPNDLTSGIVNTTFTVSETETTNLLFVYAAGTSSNNGAVLDNIEITGTEAPEPSSMLLMGTGLLAMIGLAGRKFSGISL